MHKHISIYEQQISKRSSYWPDAVNANARNFRIGKEAGVRHLGAALPLRENWPMTFMLSVL